MEEIYQTVSGRYTIFNLEGSELKGEGEMMGSCVGGESYRNKIKNQKSFILSLRGQNGKSHMTIEIAVQKQKKKQSWKVVQCLGKANTEPKDKYLLCLKEFVLSSNA